VSAEYGVFLGLDVGKGDHHAVGLARDGKRLHDAPLPNTEARLRALFDKLARHGRILVVVDQPASIGALAVAVARACGHQVAYLPGLAMRRLAGLHPGTAKTDARDAACAPSPAPAPSRTCRQHLRDEVTHRRHPVHQHRLHRSQPERGQALLPRVTPAPRRRDHSGVPRIPSHPRSGRYSPSFCACEPRREGVGVRAGGGVSTSRASSCRRSLPGAALLGGVGDDHGPG
jgi:hypothetical protein